ncbi:MAG: cysteine desulfurase [Alphaproteobacteria bacterium]|nr:cysteine desulfurase [Alphaproteobacteria bacterium]
MSFDPARLRAEFPILARTVHGQSLHYLDNGATAQMPRAVLERIVRHESESRANVLRGVHALAEAATEAFEAARATLARYIGAGNADEVVFTNGTTSAINLVAHGFGNNLAAGDEVVVSALEHHSNIVPWQMLRDRRGVVLKVLPVTAEGRIDMTALERVIGPRCRLVAITHCSNVTGAITDVGRIAAAARAVGAALLLDGAQVVPHGPVDVAALGADFYAFSGHKMYGPNGIGVLWGRRERLAAMAPLLGGGEMIRSVSFAETTYADAPHRFEAGTPPIAQAVGMAAAAEWILAQDREGWAAHERRLTGRILDGLALRDGVRVIGPLGLQGRAPVVSFAVAGAHPHDICEVLDQSHGVALRGGHHCAQPLMELLGVSGTTRASLGPYNDDGDVDALLRGLDHALQLLRR